MYLSRYIHNISVDAHRSLSKHYSNNFALPPGNTNIKQADKGKSNCSSAAQRLIGEFGFIGRHCQRYKDEILGGNEISEEKNHRRFEKD